MLFLRPYCSNELWSLSSDIILLFKSLTFFLSCWFLTWRFLMITSFKFSTSLSEPLNLEINFFFKFKIRSLSSSRQMIHFLRLLKQGYFLCCKHVKSWLISCLLKFQKILNRFSTRVYKQQHLSISMHCKLNCLIHDDFYIIKRW